MRRIIRLYIKDIWARPVRGYSDFLALNYVLAYVERVSRFHGYQIDESQFPAFRRFGQGPAGPYAGAPGIQAPQTGQQHASQLQKSLAVPPHPGNFDTLHGLEITDSRETGDQVRKFLKREHARPETGFRPRHCGIHRATHINTSENTSENN
jgi:hypothetical protein